MQRSASLTLVAIFALSVFVLLVAYAVLREDRGGRLTVSFLDVGQGDAIFIDAPSGRQVLIDGGKGPVVLEQLARVMPWWDKTIDVVIATHPDADHIGGLVDVLERYKVARVVASSVEGDTGVATSFDEAIRAEGAVTLEAQRGQRFELGKGVRLDVLFPDRDVPHIPTNDGSTVARLVYGETDFILTGDAPQGVEEYLAALDGEALRADVLKAGHHGSDTSSSPIFLGYVSPAYGVYSRGCDNSYGHPAPEVVARFAQLTIPTLDTCTEGTITFVSDGRVLSLR